MHMRMFPHIICTILAVSGIVTVGVGAAPPDPADGGAFVTSSGKTLTGEHADMFREYTQRLRDYPAFATGEAQPVPPRWYYAPADDPGFRELVARYDLETIAGQGGECDRALRVMDWVHRILTTTGEVTRPPILTAPEIISYVAAGNTIYCQPRAIVLAECLSALGFHARYLSLNPLSFDSDSHSVVAVYARSLEKWIMLDPTFNTYFHDQSGTPLSYSEVREIYRRGNIPAFRPITLDMQGVLRLRGVEYFSYDEWYAVYMAKNTFWAFSPLETSYGYHATDAPKWVALAPDGYEPDETIVSRYRQHEDQLTIIRSMEQFFPVPE